MDPGSRKSPGMPRGDDRPLWSIIMGIYGYQAVLISHHLGLFRLMAGRGMTREEVAAGLDIAGRPAEALLDACVSLGLVARTEGSFALTPLAEDYLLEGSPTYFGGFLDYSIANQNAFTFEGLKKAVLENAPQIYGDGDLYASHQGKRELARAFTRMMHSHSVAPAQAWPGKIDLGGHRLMLDAGGGSGVHSIAAAGRWPDLRALILDLPHVCEVTEDYIRGAGLGDRIRTQAGDLWADAYPAADLHFYSDLFHDFLPERCLFLARKSLASLEPGGRIIVHEMLLNDDKTGPFPVAGYSVSMLYWTEGQQFSGSELAGLLREAGFADVEVIPTFGYWGIVTGRKA